MTTDSGGNKPMDGLSANKDQGRVQLQTRLRRLGDRVEGEIQYSAGKQGFADGLLRYLFLFTLIPAAFLVVQLVRYWNGAEPNFLALGWVIALAILLPLASAIWLAQNKRSLRVETVDALGEVDRQCHLEGRLGNASVFLDKGTPGGFVAASIEDAERCVERAEAYSLAQPAVALGGLSRPLLWLIAGATLLLLASQVALWTVGVPESEGDTTTAKREGAPVQPEESETKLLAQADPEEEPQREQAERSSSQKGGAEAKAAEPGEDLSDQVKESQGKSGMGKSAGAQSTSGASQSRSAPSSQSQSSKPDQRKAKPSSKKPRSKAKQAPEPEKREQEEEDAGSTAGKGSSKGSNKNPTTSGWKSKDQVTSEDDQEIEEDEETDDDEEEQESRGGVQPHLRDRRPPVSRDLQIGFGNRSNPDANGRGGPSEQKKSRGVASLVLGVPIPDRIKGQPGPGPTKVTQERVEPQAESPAPLTAQKRAARTAPLGPLSHPDVSPWARQVIRSYFLSRRQIDPKTP